jgi:hypothetical protein
VLFSLQRALLGEVFPALRAVTVEWSDAAVNFIAYVDGSIRDEDAESLSCVAAEVAADFVSGVAVDYDMVRADWPTPIMDTRVHVFLRREASLPESEVPG